MSALKIDPIGFVNLFEQMRLVTVDPDCFCSAPPGPSSIEAIASGFVKRSLAGSYEGGGGQEGVDWLLSAGYP